MNQVVKELRYLAKEFKSFKYGDEEARNCIEITVTAAVDLIEGLENRTYTETLRDLSKLHKKFKQRITKSEKRVTELEKRMILALRLCYANYSGFTTAALHGKSIPKGVLKWTDMVCINEDYKPVIKQE